MRFFLRTPVILTALFAADILCGGFSLYKNAEAIHGAREILGDEVFFASDYPTPEMVLWQNLSNASLMIFGLLWIISIASFLRWNTREFFARATSRR